MWIFHDLIRVNFRTDLPRPRYTSVEAWIAANMASKKRIEHATSAQFYIVIIFRPSYSVISYVHIWVVYIEIHTQDSK